jgi:hypothetical protein
MTNRKLRELNPKEAAQEAIFDEQSALDKLLNPDNDIRGHLSQLDDL